MGMVAFLDEEADINIFLFQLRKDTVLVINSLLTLLIACCSSPNPFFWLRKVNGVQVALPGDLLRKGALSCPSESSGWLGQSCQCCFFYQQWAGPWINNTVWSAISRGSLLRHLGKGFL